MLKLSHDGIAEDADLVSVWDRLAANFERKQFRQSVDESMSRITRLRMDAEAMRTFGQIPEN